MKLIPFAIVLNLLAVASFAAANDYVRSRPDAGMNSGIENNICLTWNRRDFVYRVDEKGTSKIAGDEEFQAIDFAFATWQSVSDDCSDFLFVPGRRISNFKVGNSSVSQGDRVIAFFEKRCDSLPEVKSHPCWKDGSCVNEFGCWQEERKTLAITSTTYNTSSGVLADADILVNASDYFWTTVEGPKCAPGVKSTACVVTDLQNTLTHEIGHALGLDHVKNAHSTMYDTTPTGDTLKRTIDEGTAKGFCSMYPRGLPPSSCDVDSLQRLKVDGEGTGTPGFQSVGCQTASDGLGGLLVGYFMACRRFRRRTRRL